MIRQLRMTAFHVRQFVSVPYFIQLMVFTTIVTTLVQFLAARAWGGITPTQGWVRGGVIGMWTTATCAAGIIGFERHKGTLAHLVMAPIGALRSLAAVVCAAASFGLAALPVAWCTWAVASGSVDFTVPGWMGAGRMVLAAGALLAGCLALSLVIAALFVLTPNAIAYEELLLVPAFIASGILFTAASPPAWLAGISRFLPLSAPFDLLLGRAVSAMDAVGWLVCVAAWLGLAAVLGRRALWLATRAGTLEVI
ncbi:ABC-2 type transport system permease protein [Actinomyces ruminicola]|uniref:ABC-2 type transport system permease protein n=1 Tax=Actinomyces ruminicola TaxID=332524 RepID=A0A1H0CMD3_9ACTO|nr:ABC transporter permease [Actinomyces ruminicola]SDN58983.1 ABC-2 type transport system permease protein [Actinomyces ruminicola]